MSSLARYAMAPFRLVGKCERYIKDKVRASDRILALHFRLCGYNRKGLYAHDIVRDDWRILNEAVERLPAEERAKRNYRILRAAQLAITHTILPEDEWVTYEENKERGYYLQPYIDQVQREMEERHRLNYMEPIYNDKTKLPALDKPGFPGRYLR